MSSQTVTDPEAAHYQRMRVLKILGVVLAICLACGLGTVFGGGLVYGVMKVREVSSPLAGEPVPVVPQPRLEREEILPAPSAVIIEVMPGSPAEEAGLQAADVVVAVDGESLGGERGLADLVAGRKPGDRIRLTVTRPGEGEVEITVRLGEHPDKAGTAYMGVRYADSPSSGVPGPRFMPYGGGQGLGPDAMPFMMPGGEVEMAVVIRSIVEDSPASAAGLQEGDIITAVDGEAMTGPEALVEKITGYKPGDRVTLSVRQSGGEEEQAMTVTLGRHPDDPERAFLGVSVGGVMESLPWEGGQLPEGFHFRFFGPDGNQMPFDSDQLPFNPEDLPFDWHEFEPDFSPGDGSA